MSRSFTILLADDDAVLRELIAEELEAEGYTVEQAAHGKDALQKYQKGAFDVVITDHHMPEMTGVDFLNKVSELDHHSTQFFLLSGFVEESLMENDKLKIGDLRVKVITKPVSMDDLLSEIRGVGKLAG